MGVLDRLKRRREFLVVASQGRKWAAPGLILQARPRTFEGRDTDLRSPALAPDVPPATASSGRPAAGLPPPATDAPRPDTLRIGFTVSRKVGQAVVRNRVRRRLKAAAEAVMPLQARAAYDYVIIGRQQTMTRTFPALLQDLETALRKTGTHRHADAKDAQKHGDRSRRA